MTKGWRLELQANALLFGFGPLLCYLSTWSWLKPGFLLGRGDIFPYILLNPNNWTSRLLAVWDDRLNLGGPADFAKNAWLFAFSWTFHRFGDGQLVQHAFYGFAFAAQFASMAFYVKTILPATPRAAFAAALFYCFNVSMYQVFPYPMFVFFLALVPFMCALLIRALRDGRHDSSLIGFVVVGSTSGILFQNPPTYVLFVLALVTTAAVMLFRDRRLIRERSVKLSLMALGTIAVNVYWLIPSYSALLGAGHESVNAVTLTSWLDFVSRRSSMLNAFWLEPYWAWGFQIYYPFIRDYEKSWLILASFVPILVCFSSGLVPGRDNAFGRYSVFGILVLLLLIVGIHEPYGFVYKFLFDHVPLFWLFREPTTKFTLLVIVLMAPLVGRRIADGAAWLGRATDRGWVEWLSYCTLTIAVCIPAYALVQGKLEGYRDYDGIHLVSNKIRVPAYWNDLATYLQKSDGSGRVLLLPNDDFYAVRYSWNLYAADSDVLTELISNPLTVVTPSSSPTYLSSAGAYSKFQNAFYESIVGRVRGSLTPFLRIQGIRYIVERRDLSYDLPGRQLVSPGDIATLIASNPSIHFVRSFGKLDLYELNSAEYVAPVYETSGSTTERSGLWGLTTAPIRPVAIANVSPAAIDVRIPNARRGDELVFAESFHPGWSACSIDKVSGSCVPLLTHHTAFGFENAWSLPSEGSYRVRLRYATQAAANIGYAISASVLTCLGLVLMFQSVGLARGLTTKPRKIMVRR